MQIDGGFNDPLSRRGLLSGALLHGVGARHFDYTIMCSDY
jgi:hypothetical protein